MSTRGRDHQILRNVCKRQERNNYYLLIRRFLNINVIRLFYVLSFALTAASVQLQTRTQSPLIYSFSHWNMGRRSMHRAKPFFRPSLDAPRTPQILPINHNATREATGYESGTAIPSLLDPSLM